jgi:hypothetical protein
VDNKMTQDQSAEAVGWLKELWPDGRFVCPSFNPHAFLGAYTLYCFLVERNGNTYLFKRYNFRNIPGIHSEKANYDLFESHSIIPELIDTLPIKAKHDGHLHYGILIPYYRAELIAPSLLETLAIALNLASIFQCFAEAGRIYFDLKPDSLRLDAKGALHLIDFTDLIPPEDLYKRGEGLPVIDRQSVRLPPEGLQYQKAYDRYLKGRESWETVRSAAKALQADAFHSFTLASFTIQLLGGRELDDEVVSAAFARSAAPGEGAFTPAEQSEFGQLLKEMRHRSIGARLSLAEARRRVWQLIESRLTAAGNSSDIVRKARQLLSTLPRPAGDALANEIHSRMQVFWRNSHDI